MTAYLALTQNVEDLDAYQGKYVPDVLPLLQKHGIEVQVAHFGANAVEGSADSLVILRADSETAFHEFYDDPDYADLKALRQSITTNADMVVAPEFSAPN